MIFNIKRIYHRSMKTNLKLLLPSLIVIWCCEICAQIGIQQSVDSPANTFSLDRNDIRGECRDQEYWNYTRHLMDHTVVPETLPADQDTNDLWGPPTNGMQLSVRFRNNEYTVSEGIPVISILRNLEPYSRTLTLTDSPTYYVTFLVNYGTNGLLPERKFKEYHLEDYSDMPSPPSGYFAWGWTGRSEKELVLDLNGHFNMDKPGNYFVRAVCRVYSPTNKMPLYEISSGTASFRLLPRPPNGQK